MREYQEIIMEIKDPVHGSIHIKDEEVPIIHHSFFQRLRNVKQLGFSEYIFPGATHTRLLHAIGVMSIGSKVFDNLFTKKFKKVEFERLKETFKLACLLHDIGHAPLSHATEVAMPPLSSLKLDKRFIIDGNDKRKATHEDYTIKAITDSSFAESFKQVEEQFGINRNSIAELITGHSADPSYFTVDGVNYFPILHQLISSEMDCDRMDYLLRDSYFCGVSYGSFDLDWLIDNLEICINNDQASLGINERAVVTFDDFLISRFHMFLMVYFHYRSVCLEQLLVRFFETAANEYSIPPDIEKYVEHDDYLFMKVLRNSNNKYADAIVHNKIPTKIFESFNEAQLNNLQSIQSYLMENDIEFIRCSSSGRLSKYYNENLDQQTPALKVVRKSYQGQKTSYSNIDQATDLFRKFSKSHAVNRLHCNIEELSSTHKKHLLKLINDSA